MKPPSLGLALEEPVHVNIWKTKLDGLGLSVGPWLHELKQAIVDRMPDSILLKALGHHAKPVTLSLGALRGAVRVVPGQKIAYVVDVRDNEENAARIEHLASGADVLFIECAFVEADAEHARQRNHLTAWQAGLLARRAKVGRLVPCHFSTRYTSRRKA